MLIKMNCANGGGGGGNNRLGHFYINDVTSYYNVYTPYNVFMDATTKPLQQEWCASGNITWISIKFDTSATISKIVVINWGAGNQTETAKTLKLQGSNDNSTWTDIDTYNLDYTSKGKTDIDVNGSTAYQYYKFTIANSGSYCGIGSLALYGSEE